MKTQDFDKMTPQQQRQYLIATALRLADAPRRRRGEIARFRAQVRAAARAKGTSVRGYFATVRDELVDAATAGLARDLRGR